MEKKPFSDKRWTDIPLGRTVGHVEVSDEKRLQERKSLEESLKKDGILKPGEHLGNG